MILYYLQLWYYEINFIFSNRIFLSFLFYSSYIDTYSYTYQKKKKMTIFAIPRAHTFAPQIKFNKYSSYSLFFFIAENVHIGYCSKYSYWLLLKISGTESPQDMYHYTSYESSVFFPWNFLYPHSHFCPGARIEHVVRGVILSLWPKLLCITLACSD